MTTDTTSTAGSDYPVRYAVDYPEGGRNRLTALVRLILVIPVLVLLILVSSGGGGAFGGGAGWGDAGQTQSAPDAAGPGSMDDAVIGAIVVFAVVAVVLGPAMFAAAFSLSAGSAPLGPAVGLMLIFRRRYPRWWFDFNREVARFGARVGAYAALQRDEYPATDDEQAVHLEIDYPDAQALNRWLPLVKWLLAIPHYIVLFFLFIALVFTTLIAWFAVVILGRYPRGLFNYAVGVARWTARVSGYAFLLVTDRYPPFSLR